MQYAMQIFEYEDSDKFRVIDMNGEPWFILSEVCSRLEISNTSDAASRLDDDEKGIATIDTLGGRQRKRIINESGLYSLILTSRKPAAKKFKKWITSEVLPSIRKTGSYNGHIPKFIRRYNSNWDRIDQGYFSVISELVVRLWGRMELVGHIMADRSPNGTENRPDVSVGGLFAKWLDANHPTVCTDYKYYKHVTAEWEGDARQYPNTLLPLFIEFIDTVWIPQHSIRYFNTRDPAALPYLPLLIANNNQKQD